MTEQYYLEGRVKDLEAEVAYLKAELERKDKQLFETQRDFE